MRVLTVNGIRTPNYMGCAPGARPMGNLPGTAADPTAGIPAGDTAAPPAGAGNGALNTVEDVQASVGYLGWAQSMVATGNSIIRKLMQALGLGPGYESEGGGEIRRQLQSEAMGAARWTDKAIELYMAWLRDYHPRRGVNTPGRLPGEGYGSGFDERVNPCSFTLAPDIRRAIESGSIGAQVVTGQCADIWTADGFTPSDFVAWMNDRIPGWRPERAAIAPTPEQDLALRTIALQRIGLDGPEGKAQGDAAYLGLDYDWQRLVDAYQGAYMRRVATDPTGGAPPTPPTPPAGTPPPNDEQLAILQQLAVGLAGLAGEEARTTGLQLYVTLPQSWQRLVDAMVTQLGGTPPTPPATTEGGGGLALLALLGLLALA